MREMELIYLLTIIATTHAFFESLPGLPFKWLSLIQTPTTNDELVNALCATFDSNYHCNDSQPAIIFITKTFDFRNLGRTLTEVGCYHLDTPDCLIHGQKKLNRFNQCDGLRKTNITYNEACITPLRVGSNKYIISRGGTIMGKGLFLLNSDNVLIYGLSITDVCPDLIFGGDAIALNNATNVWIHRNYIARIGRQMVATGFGASRNITFSYNEFDGRTQNSAYCDGYHYWLWLFQGCDDTITLYKNYVHHTSGRGPHATGLNNTKTLIHIINNVFVNIADAGLVEVFDPTGRLLIEGNTYVNVTYVVSKDGGHIYFPFTVDDAKACKQYFGRNCYMNTIINTGGLNFKSQDMVLKELSNYRLIDTNLIDKYDELLQASLHL